MPHDLPTRLPPRQQLVGPTKWPVVGESSPAQRDTPWRLSIRGRVDAALEFSLAELEGLIDFDGALDIHCVTRWSKYDVRFRGVRLLPLLAQAQVQSDARFVSFVARSERHHSTSLPLAELESLDPLIALYADNEPLASQHGGPIRLIVPGRYFYKSVKWLESIEVLVDDRLGYWEANAGYHNHADPWLEERFMSPSFSKREAQERLAARDFSDCDLRGFDGQNRNLDRLQAVKSRLRNANFSGASLVAADFREANLSDAQLVGCDLRHASFHLADCEGADFTGADLRGADFTGASLFGATFFTDQTPTTQANTESPSKRLRLGPNFPWTEQQLAMLTDSQAQFLRSVVLEPGE